MKKLALIFIVFTIWSLDAQNRNPVKIGIGVVFASNPYLYEDMSHYNQIYKDKQLQQKIKANIIFPYFYKPDYGLYHFICLEKTNTYYKY